MRKWALSLLALCACASQAQTYSQDFDLIDLPRFNDVAVDGVRNIYVAGSDQGQLVVRGISEAGAELWTTTVANTSQAFVDRIVLDADGNIYVAARSGPNNAREFVLISLNRTTGATRFIKRVASIDELGFVGVATVKVSNSILLYAVTTAKVNATNSDILAFRLNPNTGAEIWRSQISLGSNTRDLGLRVAVNSNGAPFFLGRRDAAGDQLSSVLRLSGTDGSVTFRKDFPGAGVRTDGMHVLTGNNNIGVTGSTGDLDTPTFVSVINGNTGATIRESKVSGFTTGALPTKFGAMMVPRSGGNPSLFLKVEGATGLFTQSPFIQGGDRLLAIDGADQIHVTQSITGPVSKIQRFPAGGFAEVTFGSTAGVVDNKNRLIVVGFDGDFGHVARFTQSLATNDDVFSTSFGGNLVVPAPGVLANDFAPGATLELVDEPTSGLVGLSQNGAINYVPNDGTVINDQFTYKATLNGQSRTSTVRIRRNSFVKWTTFGTSVIGSQGLTAFLEFAFPPTIPAEATITDNSAVLFTDPKINLNSLDELTSVPITTNVVTSSLAVTLTATAYGVSHSVTINVLTGGLGELTLGGSGSMVAGETAVGRVTITAPAPAGGREITLTKLDGNATIPGKVTIPAGSTFGIFTILTPKVTTGSTLGVRATLFNGVRNTFRIITPMPKLTTVEVPSTIVGGVTFKARLVLDKITPYNLPIPTTYTSSPSGIASGPTSPIVVQTKSEVSFDVTTQAVTAAKLVRIRSVVGGGDIEKLVTVIPNPLQSVSVSPSTITAGLSAEGTVSLNNLAPTGGITVALSTNRPSLVIVPASVSIATASWSATFSVKTRPVTNTTGAAVNAKLGLVTKTTTITIVP